MDEYKDAMKSLRLYFFMHPDVRKLYASPFFLAALIFAGLSYQRWLAADWPAIPLLVLPALLGFSLAAFILLLTMGSEEFRAFLQSVKSARSPRSVLQHTFGVFSHFILVQICALLAAVIGDAHPLRSQAHLLPAAMRCPLILNGLHIAANALSYFAYALFFLSITTSAAAAFAVLTLAKWYSEFLDVTRKETTPKPEPRPLERV